MRRSKQQTEKAHTATALVSEAAAKLAEHEQRVIDQRAYRDAKIREAFAAGATWGEIGDASGLSKGAVAKVRSAGL